MKNHHWISMVIVICLCIVGLSDESTNCQAAEKYPARPIQVIIGYEPGSTDQALRPFIEYMTEYLGQPMNFVFKPGASGSIGATYVATSKPDGYTLMGASMAPLITSPLTMKAIKYTLEDFTPICRPMTQANGLAVKGDARWKNIKEFIDEARKNPGKLAFTNSGLYNTSHIPIALLQKEAGIKLTQIPATGSGPSITAVLGGHVDSVSSPMQALSPHLKSGQLRALVFSGARRSQFFPDVPIYKDLGYNITSAGYNCLVGPKGMPEDVVQTLIRASDYVMTTHKKDMEEHFKRQFSDPGYLTGEELGKALRADWETTKQIIEELQKSAK